jgi:hypothetical protein
MEIGACVAENVTRYGTSYLHSFCCGDTLRLYQKSLMLNHGTWEELRLWEARNGYAMDGLRMTVVGRIAKKAACSIGEVPGKVMRILAGLPLKLEDEETGGEETESDETKSLDGDNVEFESGSE